MLKRVFKKATRLTSFRWTLVVSGGQAASDLAVDGELATL